ncbi:reverse transcriptase domain-containing protein [Tanacetum coccineum]
MTKALYERPQGALPSNTIPNPREEIKSITTRSGIVLAGPFVPPPPVSASSKEVKRDPNSTTDEILEIPLFPTSKIPELNPHQPPIPYQSRLNKEKLQDKTDSQIHSFLKMFKRIYFIISFFEALALMLKFSKMLKDLLTNKEKLLELANNPLNENCSAVLLKKLPEKLGDTGRFLIPCDFYALESCMALADLGVSINLMPLSVWKKLSLPELAPTRMTLELATRTVAYPVGIAEDVFVQVGKFTFRADFVVVDYNVDPRVPLSGDEKLILKDDSTSKSSHRHESANMINFIDITYEDHCQEVLDIIHPLSGSSTPSSDPIDEPSEVDESEIYPLIGEPFDTFLIGDDGIKVYPFKEIDDPVPIPRVSETPLDSLDSTLDLYDTSYTNPLFELGSEYTLNYDNPIFNIQNEHSDEPRTKSIMDKVHSIAQIPPLFEELTSDMSSLIILS